MLTFKRSILVLAFLAGGFAACSSSNSSPDADIIGATGGTGGSTSAGGSGGTVATGGTTESSSTVAIDAGTMLDTAASGGAIAIDAGLAIDSGAVSPDARTVVDVAGSSVEAGSTTATKAGHLAIINAPVGAGVIALDVTGAAPPAYDPGTGTCQ